MSAGLEQNSGSNREKSTGGQRLNLWFLQVSVPRVSTGCISENLSKWSRSGISAECTTVLAPAQWDVSCCAQQMGAGKFVPSIEVCTYIHENICTVCVSLDPGRAAAGSLSLGCIWVHVRLSIFACPWHAARAQLLHWQMDAHSQATLNLWDHC